MTKTMTNTTNSAVDFGAKSKNDVLDFLKDVLNHAKENKINKNLAGRIAYTVDQSQKNPKLVLKSDLVDLATEVADTFKAAVKSTKVKPIEASAKPKTEKETTKKPLKSTPKKAEEQTAEKPKAEKAKSLFPATINTEALGKLKALPKKFTTYEELVAATNEEDFDGEIYILVPWTPEQIKKFKYSERFDVPEVESFPDNYDILQVVMVCERVERFFAMSTYTDAMFEFEGADLAPTEYTDGVGKVLKNRISYGMEFEFYTKAE